MVAGALKPLPFHSQPAMQEYRHVARSPVCGTTPPAPSNKVRRLDLFEFKVRRLDLFEFNDGCEMTRLSRAVLNPT